MAAVIAAAVDTAVAGAPEPSKARREDESEVAEPCRARFVDGLLGEVGEVDMGGDG